MKINNIDFDEDYIRTMAESWSIDELAVFGSILTDDFKPDSDIDFLVTFSPSATLGLFEMVQLKTELENHFNRKVDLVEKPAIANPFRRKSILESARMLYVN
ncbi:MAG: nucleotidyltransferase domain-containing protein [Deltaproteobacteria bacterium]|nr:nucleotidyltransferase domain-containing protein [Deltaproteobacteria bacterium]MBN2671050.1 nucleotidyltransferase domain-containing protein [Deltaproteobacteria bacterium]